ncbi:maternal protein exuperantia-like [Acropora millepora]|uniref:maternal protein exuperantia-like n=1 Tax=Acropora millepora TaxID=45264 RepID=UPI001CF5F3AD|nr:maternal protein exuperantia-like [Acropora millepora]
MDKKVLSDRTRKATKKFKYRRNQLRGQKSNQNSQKEAKEGKTYETAVALNLDTSVNQPTPRTCTHIEHLVENISDNELHEYEKLVPSYYAQPDLPKLTYDPNQTYIFVVFDTETTCTGKNAELCQLSAIQENHVFSKYILPTGNVSTGASRVNKLSEQNINGIRKLLKENQPVETVSLDKALQEFHTFLSHVKCSSQKESCIVLIGHNSSTFDTPILLRKSNEIFRRKLSNLNVYFGDSQILVKHLLKNKHPALQLSESTSCKSNQSALYSHLFKEEFEAHDALEDVKALTKILCFIPHFN